ncbi:MAG: hypothetical protein ABIR38_02190 [Chthoniobacterales bacterium]
MANHLSLEDRLAALRTADHERRWYSLDDKRVCVICERVFRGRQVEITQRGGAYILRCPTPDCPSSSTHWFLIHPHAPEEATPVPGADGKAEFRFFLP